MTTPQERSRIRTKLEHFEGCLEHMYLDTKGYVTVGIGHLLPSAADAQKLPFVRQKDNRPAAKEKISDDYTNVIKQVKGLVAASYRRYTTLKLHRTTIDSITDRHINQFATELRGLYGKEFDNYPTEVRLALFDMIFNLGPTKLRTLFPNFNGHIKAGRWAEAAMESSRRDIPDERNDYVHTLLQEAAMAANTTSVS